MNPPRVTLAGLRPADWQIGHAPRRFAFYVVAVQAATIALTALYLTSARADASSWSRFGILLVLALVFEEGARRTAFLQLRLSSALKSDMTSVWGIAAAVALRPGPAALLVLVLLSFTWLRQQRPAGEILHRKAFNAGAAVLATIAASSVAHAVLPGADGAAWHVSGTLAVLAAIATDALVTRALVTAGLLFLGMRGRALLGGVDNNMLELATLSLGGLVGLAAAHQPLLCILALVPMTALQRGAVVRELETAATVDSKTGLLNATAWEVMARRELVRAERDETPTSVLVIDVDRFKAVNDRFGHLAGDSVLRAIARALSDEVREYDSVGRFGGEEFVAVLPSTSEGDAVVIAERMRARVNQFHVRTLADRALHPGAERDGDGDDPVSVSIGVASSPVDGHDLSDLLLAADSALYRAKSDGRNRVALARRGTDVTPGTGAAPDHGRAAGQASSEPARG